MINPLRILSGRYNILIFDVLIIADNLPQNWRQRDTIILDLDRHGIFDIILYTGEELENAINAANPVIMNVFDRPHKILYGKSFIDRKAQLFTDEVEKHHILRLGDNTWKISGGINDIDSSCNPMLHSHTCGSIDQTATWYQRKSFFSCLFDIRG